ncbi:VOC family protein [Chryseobacterium sp. MP_3.2]|uniref:VOC family protein n=1 Tax=Chryseobacterium sp. MP_3.2 TaxID=3071712 RepID=UPI002DFA5CD7|nr:hypothetical protein [Chryseobacterium sp. MP_3.2]
MLTSIHPKLPMRNKQVTHDYFVNVLKIKVVSDYIDYLLLEKDKVEIHFFLFEDLKPEDNYVMIYIRTNAIEELYKSFLDNNVTIHPNGPLEIKSWGQKEFSLLDPDFNLLTFGKSKF